MRDRDTAPTPDDLYASAVGNDAAQPAGDEGESEPVESNSSNYGGSSLAEERIERRVLGDE